ncbi:MAG: hypothetical protein IKR11_07710 [Solobacterium sp.]|nr:hypothetical protein [Solobacterium sp.]
MIRYYINIPNFKLYKSYLKTICIEGEHTFNKNWKILKDFGYLTQVKENSDTGYVYIYDLKDSPEGENPHLGNPHLGNPGVGNHCLEKEISNKQVSNNNESIIKETIDTERIRKMLDPFINIEIQRAKEVNADPQEVKDSFKDFLIALSSYKDPDMVRKINIYGQDPVFDLWKKVYEELYDTSILGRPNRTVFNKY